MTQRAFERNVARKTFVGGGSGGAPPRGGSAYRFLEVHNAENGVSSLKSTVAGLNTQIPTYDKVVAITDELRVAEGEVTQISSKAVDWSAVVTQLQQRIPAGLSVTTFSGTAAAGHGLPRAASATSATAGDLTAAGAAPAGAIGSLTMGVSGAFPSSAHFDPWRNGSTA